MSGGLFQASTIPVLEQAVNFGQARHNVLAGNLANIDTPGYKARDLSTALFQNRLKEAIETRNSPTSYDADCAIERRWSLRNVGRIRNHLAARRRQSQSGTTSCGTHQKPNAIQHGTFDHDATVPFA